MATALHPALAKMTKLNKNQQNCIYVAHKYKENGSVIHLLQHMVKNTLST